MTQQRIRISVAQWINLSLDFGDEFVVEDISPRGKPMYLVVTEDPLALSARVRAAANLREGSLHSCINHRSQLGTIRSLRAVERKLKEAAKAA